MKLEDIREAYYSHTATASRVARQISFAGIAVIWIFKTDKLDSIALPETLISAAIALLLSLSFDLLQYIYASAAWGIFHRYNERKKGVDYSGEVYAPMFINWPSNIFFWGKLTFLMIGYFFLLIYGLSSIKS